MFYIVTRMKTDVFMEHTVNAIQILYLYCEMKRVSCSF